MITIIMAQSFGNWYFILSDSHFIYYKFNFYEKLEGSLNMVDILLNRFRIKSVIRTGEWSESQPKKWYESILISPSKKEFQNNRTINLITHPSKSVSSTRERGGGVV